MPPQVFSLREIDENTHIQIGGKAKNLLKLARSGISVPEAWVVPAEVFQGHLEKYGLDPLAQSVASCPTSESCGHVQQSLRQAPLDEGLCQSLAALPDVSFAVRSSASVEDGARGSYAGLFETFLGVKKGSELADAVKGVWASAFALEALTYHQKMAAVQNYPSMAVLIMPLIDARAAGVAFSVNPASGNPFQMVINAGLGLATTVVDGTETCQRYLLDSDTFEIVEVDCGRQETGDFVDEDGRVSRARIAPTHRQNPILTDEEVRHLGQVVRSIDEALGCRVDVEVAFHAGGLAILQARPALGLPPFFPDNPQDEEKGIICSHQTWNDPAQPFFWTTPHPTTHRNIPSPPWPLEVEEIFCHHGRIFARIPPPPEIPDWEDRSFLERMEALDEPEREFEDWWPWTDHAYRHIIPALRQGAERILALEEARLGSLTQEELGRLLAQAVDLEAEAGVFYISSSFPTAESLTFVQALAFDWLMDRDWKKSDMFAVSMVQGSPKLTHERDGELEAIAWDGGDLDPFIERWGFSYLVRDELLFLDRWKSWREDPRPLLIAIEQMRKRRKRRPIGELVENAARESKVALEQAIQQLRASSPQEGEKRAKILEACVKACRVHYPMKDDRDLVLSHAQSALRWVLMEADRRLRETGITQSEGEVFMFAPPELVEYFAGRGSSSEELSGILRERQREQARLCRYSLPSTEPSAQEDLPRDQVLQGDPASAGIAEGRACVVRTDAYEDISRLEEGDILVLKGEGKVGWTMFFTSIAGLVYTNGNWLSHETTLCRELGKPAVVGLVEEIELIEEGELLRIDGAEGTVLRLEREGANSEQKSR